MNQPNAPSDLPDSIKANINHGEPRPLDGRSGEPDRAGAPAKVEKKQTAERPEGSSTSTLHQEDR